MLAELLTLNIEDYECHHPINEGCKYIAYVTLKQLKLMNDAGFTLTAWGKSLLVRNWGNTTTYKVAFTPPEELEVLLKLIL